MRKVTLVRCDEVTELLSDVADGSLVLERSARRHVDRCLRCQAELVQYRKLLRALHALRTEVLEPAPGLLADILAQKREELSALRARKLPAPPARRSITLRRKPGEPLRLLAELKRLGCDLAQGNQLSPALPAAAFREWWSKNS